MRLTRSLQTYFVRHAQVALNSLGRLYRLPMASLMTAAVIGIALALPSGLYLLTGNLQRLSTQWDGSATLSLFLEKQVSRSQAQALGEKLNTWSEIESLRVITPEQALAEFRALSGFGEALDALDVNPLPAVLAIKPAPSHSGAESAAALLEKLRSLPEVELAQLDLQWVKRFHAIVDIVRRAIWVMAALLGLAVLLIIGNTIRLEIQNRREEGRVRGPGFQIRRVRPGTPEENRENLVVPGQPGQCLQPDRLGGFLLHRRFSRARGNPLLTNLRQTLTKRTQIYRPEAQHLPWQVGSSSQTPPPPTGSS